MITPTIKTHSSNQSTSARLTAVKTNDKAQTGGHMLKCTAKKQDNAR